MSIKKSKSELLRLALIGLCCQFVVTLCQASSASSEQQLLQQIAAQYDAVGDNTEQMLVHNAEFVRLAKQKKWSRAEVTAAGHQAYLYCGMGEFEEAERWIQAYANRPLDRVTRSHFLSAELYLSSARQQRELFDQQRQQATKLATELGQAGEQHAQGNLLLELGNDLIVMNDYEQALLPIRAGTDIFLQLNDEKSLLNANGALASLYANLGYNEQALNTYLAILAAPPELLGQMDRSVLLYNTAESYDLLGLSAQSSDYLLQARAISESLQDELGLGYVDLLWAKQQNSQQHYAQALATLKRIAPLFPLAENEHRHFQWLCNTITSYIGLQQFNQAESQLNQLKQAYQAASTIQQPQIDKLTYELASARGDHQAALVAYQAYAQSVAEKANISQHKTLQQLIVELSAEQVAVEKDQLLRREQLNQAQLQRMSQLHWALLFAMCAALLVGFILYRRYYRQR